MKSKRGNGSYIYGFKWRKSRAENWKFLCYFAFRKWAIPKKFINRRFKKKKVKVPRSSREKFRFNKYIVINMICTRSGSMFLQIPLTIIYFSKMKSKRGSGSYIYGFKWRKSRANFRQRWNFKISPHRRHKSFHCMRWCCVTRHGQIWQCTRNPNNLPIKSRSGRIVASSDRSSLHV